MIADPSQKETLLVVDDNHQNIKLLCTVLNQENYNLAVAFSGKDALQIMRSSPISIVLLDIMMPEMDGFEVCTQMKNDPQLDAIPVIFVSALNDAENITRAFQVGGSDYIYKPVKSAELFVKIRTQLELFHYRNNASQSAKTKSLLPKNNILQMTGEIKASLQPTENMLNQLVPKGIIIQPNSLHHSGTSFHIFKKGDQFNIVIMRAEYSVEQNALWSLVSSESLKAIALNGFPSESTKALEYLQKHLTPRGIFNEKEIDKPSIGILSCNAKTNTIELATDNVPILYYSNKSDSYEIITQSFNKDTGKFSSYPIYYQPKDRIYVFDRKSMLVVKHILKNINIKMEDQRESLEQIMKEELITTLIGIEL